MKNQVRLLLLELEELNEKASSIEQQKITVRQRLADCKKLLEKENAHLIGRKALCTHVDNPELVECVCTAVVALDDYSSVIPLFARRGKKYSISTYEWIE